MKAKKLFALVLVLAMVVSLVPAVYAAETDPLSIADAKVTVLTPKVDGKDLIVTKYEDTYCASPNRPADQQIALFVPETATADSPIIYMVDNSGWRSDAYADVKNTVASYGKEMQTLPPFQGGGTVEVQVGDYKTGENDRIGECLANGYIIMVAGLRSRADGLTGEEYLGHSPATMTDAKAAIRFVKYNADALPAGNTDRIVITGTSGGGALSVVTAASGNSADYYESLYEIGAAGIVKNADGSYSDTLSDDIWATIAYCPITDLGNACAAYEWQWADARIALIESGADLGSGFMAPKYPAAETMAEATEYLIARYEAYLDSLGLETVSAANLEETIIKHMTAEIEESIKEIGVEQMKADLKGADWLVFNEDGTYTYDYEKHVNWVGTQTAFKAPSAFSNVGMKAWAGNMNEDDLFGSRSDAYSPFNAYAWEHDDTDNEVGMDDTGLTWDEYMATAEGKALAKQIKMTSPIQYLQSETDGDSAPNWYVRYGMADRDSSFAVEAVLNAALDADKSIEDKTFEYAWLKGHAGDYDVQEAYAWLAEQLAEDTDPLSFADAKKTVLTPKLDGKDITVTMYEDVYCASPNRVQDQKIAVYVPDNATASSPIIFMVNNGGWQSNSYSGRNGVDTYGWVEETKRGETKLVLKGNYVSTSDSDAVGKALSEGYVIVSCGARSRNNGATDGLYLGHSPATMTDTKAAFRYLRYNADLLPAGDPEKIVVTGTSGGGALSVVLSASGDSADYFESLYEIGAAGIEKKADGSYVSTISDAIWGTIAYCPITDFASACAAYEWTWGAARTALMEAGAKGYDYAGISADEQNAASAELKASFEEYLDALGIGVTSDTMEDAIIELMEKEIAESIKEFGVAKMKKDLGDYDWLVINDDGSFTYNYEKHVLATGMESTFKAASAFSNYGLYLDEQEQRNEDNLFGTVNDDYSPFNEYAWNNDKRENEVGKDDTGKTWDEYMATAEGKALAKQLKMTSPIEYLLSETDGTSAPNWYVRYGMYDRDSSWAIETMLYYTILEDKSIEDIDFEFAWLKGHSGNYDVQEAYAWLAEKVGNSAPVATNQNITVDGKVVKPEAYNVGGENYFKLRDIAYLLNGTDAQFSVDYIDAARAVYVVTGEAYKAIGGEMEKGADKSASCVLSTQSVIIDALASNIKAYNFGGNNYFRLRDLGDALGFSVDYDDATRTVIIETK